MRCAALLVATLAVAGLSPRADAASSKYESECALAIQIVDEFANGLTQRMVMAPGGAARAEGSVGSVRRGWRSARPSSALAAAYLARGNVDAAETCPGFKAKLATRGIEHGAAAVDRVTHGRDFKRPYDGVILSLSLPVISRDGRSALVQTGLACGSLCGAGRLWLYERDRKGRWSRVSDKMIWIS